MCKARDHVVKETQKEGLIDRLALPSSQPWRKLHLDRAGQEDDFKATPL